MASQHPGSLSKSTSAPQRVWSSIAASSPVLGAGVGGGAGHATSTGARPGVSSRARTEAISAHVYQPQESTRRYRIVTFDASLSLTDALAAWDLACQAGVRVDAFAGTGTGAIVALALAAGCTPSEITTHWRISDLLRVSGTSADAAHLPRDEVRAMLRTSSATNALSRLLPAKAFASLPTRCIVTGVRVSPADDRASTDSNGDRLVSGAPAIEPLVYSNLGAIVWPDDKPLSLAEIALRVCAMPACFPVYEGCIDGTLAASANPAVTAIAEALASRVAVLSELVVLSFGDAPGRLGREFAVPSCADWGFAQWARPMRAVAADASQQMVDWQARAMLQQRYHRVTCPSADQGKLAAFVRRYMH